MLQGLSYLVCRLCKAFGVRPGNPHRPCRCAPSSCRPAAHSSHAQRRSVSRQLVVEVSGAGDHGEPDRLEGRQEQIGSTCSCILIRPSARRGLCVLSSVCVCVCSSARDRPCWRRTGSSSGGSRWTLQLELSGLKRSSQKAWGLGSLFSSQSVHESLLLFDDSVSNAPYNPLHLQITSFENDSLGIPLLLTWLGE